MTKPQRAAILAKTNGHCAYCGVELTGKWHADHLEPVRRSRRHVASEIATRKKIYENYLINPENDTLDNLWPACPSCNINKHQLSVEGFRNHIATMLDSLNKYNTNYRFARKFGLVEETKAPVEFFYEKIPCEVE